MKIKNQIVNYFVGTVAGRKSPKVYRSPITINSSVAKELLAKQFGGLVFENQSNPLHICYDVESDIVYIPNGNDFAEDTRNVLSQAARLRIMKDFRGARASQIIGGSPYSSIRGRSIDSFPKVKAIFGKLLDRKIDVVEANLSRMPETIKQLPKIYANKSEFMGGYVDKKISFIESIDVNGKKREEPMHLITSGGGPIILINTSMHNGSPITATDKEWVVLSGCREYLAKQDKLTSEIEESSDLYAINHHLSEGWSFEEVCSLLLNGVKRFDEFIVKAGRLSIVVDSLTKQGGFKNRRNYYISIEIGDDFPINLGSMIDLSNSSIKQDRQIDYFKIVDLDIKKGQLIIETPVFVSPQVCKDALNAKGEPFISCYNPAVNKIDVKVESAVHKKQALKILDFIEDDENQKSLTFRSGPSARGEWSINPNIFNMRKISDYFNASNYIKKMAKRYNVEFRDLDVIIGPIEQIMGQGSQGGFLDKRSFKKKTPHKINEDAFFDPPCILINSVTMPSYSEQAETLVHEYRHYIYSLQFPYYEIQYGSMHDKTGDDFLREWDKYMSDDNEREAHEEEVIYSLLLGKSPDEIIRDKVGGKITLENYPVALRYRKIVDGVIEKHTEE